MPVCPALIRLDCLWKKLDAEWDGGWQAGKLRRGGTVVQTDLAGLCGAV